MEMFLVVRNMFADRVRMVGEDDVKKRFAALAGMLLSLSLVLASVAPAWAEVGQRPDDGTTQGQPFAPGTAGSSNFRIPAMVALDDGTIVAATDARWNTGADGGGLDTIVSSSRDDGANWSYTLPNYLGDNGNRFSEYSTAFIDPALATDGKTVHMVVDLFPAGIALNSTKWRPVAGAPYDGNGNLRLRDASLVKFESWNAFYSELAAAAKYEYYLDLDDLVIKRAADGSVVPGYSVDAYFNITTETTGETTNLFCSDAPFQVFPTDYLYMTSSTDGGLTWGEPTLINAKRDDEQTLLIGPGTGSVLADGTIMFSVYEHTHGKEESSVVWSTDGGVTWSRSASATDYKGHWSSEAVTVEIDASTVRQFYRDGYGTLHYTDYTKAPDGTWAPGTPVDTGMKKATGNQLSAIKLSYKVEGRDAIVVSTATGPGRERMGGKLYVGLINDDKTMTWRHTYDVVAPERAYSYSTIAELRDGSIAVLYEAEWPNMIFTVVPKDRLICSETDNDLAKRDVHVVAGESVTVNDPSGDYSASDVSGIDEAIATVELRAAAVRDSAAVPGSSRGFTGASEPLSGMLWNLEPNGDGTCAVSATDRSGATVYLHPADYEASAGYPVSAEPQDVVLSAGDAANTLYLRAHDASKNNKAGYLFFWRDDKLAFDRVDNPAGNADWREACSFMLYRPVGEGEASSTEIPGYVRTDVTDPATVSGKHLIVARARDGEFYALYPSASKESKRSQAAKVIPNTDKSTDVIFTGVSAGETGVRVGSTYYRVHVADFHTADVTLDMDGEKTIVIAGKDLTGAVDASAFDTALAGFEIEFDGTDTKLVLTGKAPGETSLVVGSTRYSITVTGSVVDVALQMGAATRFEHVVAGSYDAVVNSDLDKSVATVGLEPVAGAMVGSQPRVLRDLEYTAVPADGGLAFAADLPDGTKAYLNPSGNPGYPVSADPVAVELAPSDHEAGTFNISDGMHHLFFWRDGGKNGYVFDRVTTIRGFERGTSLSVFRRATDVELANGADTEIKGYMRVDDAAQIEEGAAVLFAASANDGAWYLLNPSDSTAEKDAHVGKLADGAVTKVSIEAKAAGSGSFRVGDTRFNVTVAPEPKVHSVTFTDKFNGTETIAKVTHGDPVARPDDPAFGGYEFAGWSTSPTEHAPYDFDAPVTGDLVLYASYVKKADPKPPAPPVAPEGPDGQEGQGGPVGDGDGSAPAPSPTPDPGPEIPATGDASLMMATATGAVGAILAGVGFSRRRK